MQIGLSDGFQNPGKHFLPLREELRSEFEIPKMPYRILFPAERKKTESVDSVPVQKTDGKEQAAEIQGRG